jgi:hypothetical protein
MYIFGLFGGSLSKPKSGKNSWRTVESLTGNRARMSQQLTKLGGRFDNPNIFWLLDWDVHEIKSRV